MSVSEEWVETETGTRSWILKNGTVAQNLTGMTVALLMKNRTGASIDTSGDVVVTDAANGVVSYNPDAADFASAGSPYSVRFKVTDGTGKDRYYPTIAMQWYVLPL